MTYQGPPPRAPSPPGRTAPLVLFGVAFVLGLLMPVGAQFLGMGGGSLLGLLGLLVAAGGGFLGWRAPALPKPVRVAAPVGLALVYEVIWLLIVSSPVHALRSAGFLLAGDIAGDVIMEVVATFTFLLAALVLLVLGLAAQPRQGPRPPEGFPAAPPYQQPGLMPQEPPPPSPPAPGLPPMGASQPSSGGWLPPPDPPQQPPEGAWRG